MHRGYKIELTVEEKRALNNHSMPRPEIDLVAYKAATGELLSLECKSYFDSGGVHASDLLPGGRYPKRYKMFVDAALREMVLRRLVDQLAASGAVVGTPVSRLGLVFGYATLANIAKLEEHFAQNDWAIFGPAWLREHLQKMALRSYDNQIASVVAKLLLPRKMPTGRQIEAA